MDKTNKIEGINSWLVAIFLCSTCMAVIIPSEGIVVLTNIVLFGLIILLNAPNYIRYSSYKHSIALAGVLIILFIINMLFNTEQMLTVFFLHFICFGLPVLFFPIGNVNYCKVLRNIAILAILLVPFFLRHDYGFSMNMGGDFDDGELMTTSYRVLPLICALVLAFIDEKRKLLKLLFAVICTVYCIFLVVIGSRGAILAICVLFAFLFVSKANSSRKKVVRTAVVVAAVVFGWFSFNSIIEWLYLKSESSGIQLLPLSRLYFTITEGKDLTSGRGDIAAVAFQDFLNSPIWGNGIASFRENNALGYPHNLFLQLLQEGGLLLFLPFALIFIQGLKNIILGDRQSTYYRILLFTFCGGVMQLMFSSYYWTSSLFWFFVFLVLHKKSITIKGSYR